MIPGVGAGATVAKRLKKLNKSSKKIEGVYDLIVKNADEIKGYAGQSNDTFKRILNHFNPKRGKLAHTVLEEAPIIHKMVGSTKLEREIYEQFIILEKYGGDLTKRGADITEKGSSVIGKLFNKVNPVGGKFDLKSPEGMKKFYEKATEIAKKYNLPTTFDPIKF